ncbi:hypothetical protein Q4S17_19455, partial [Morganella morganii]
AKQKINKASLNSGAFLCAALSQSPCVNYDPSTLCGECAGRIKNNESTVSYYRGRQQRQLPEQYGVTAGETAQTNYKACS